jgi:two-component system, chemotaxis family, chemotaxis protein CheY
MARIMIVDDSLFMRRILSDILVKFKHQVVAEARNGFEAVKLYDQLMPDVVTMDITMPQLDGIRALTLIKARHPDAKVIMVSAMGQQSHMMEAANLGAGGFIIKPFNARSILEELSNCIENGVK